MKGPQRLPLADRFWPKVERRADGECWPWTGSVNAKGYGKFSKPGHNNGWEKAHRSSWQLANGAIPHGMFVLHRCDNPRCVNPTHLFLGTNADNVRDMHQKGRSHAARQKLKTHCVRGHEYTPDNTGLQNGDRRYCRECNREKARLRSAIMAARGQPTVPYTPISFDTDPETGNPRIAA